MRSQPTRRLFILSAFLFTIVAISIVGGRAFNGANSRSPQAQAHAPAHSSLNKLAGGQRRLGGVKAVSPADPNPFRSAFSFNTASGFNYASLFAPNVTAVKSATLQTDVNGNGFVNPGDTLMYSVLINNTGTDAMNVIFTDQLNANLTLIGTATASPIVVNESYDTIGNTQLQVAGSQTIASPGLFVNGNVLSNDIDPQGGTLTVTAITNGPTTAGGTVTLNTDGTFIYTPQVGDANVADTFTYTVNEPDGKTGTGTVTINIANARVWYVRNNATAGGLGRSGDPFDTLVEAQTASASGDIIYVFFGNGTTSGQNLGIALKAGQRLIGEGVALTVPVSVNGGPNPTVLRAAGSQPLLDNTAGSAVSATNVIPAEIAGLNLAGSVNAIDVSLTGALTGMLLIHDNTVRAAGAEGIDINSGTTGALTLGVYENVMVATGNALDIERTMGTLTIVTFHDNMVSGNTGGNGIVVTGTGGVVTFDAVPGGLINPVPGGMTIIGASGNGVAGAGMNLNNVAGELSFANSAMGTIGAGDLDIFGDGAALVMIGGAGGFSFSVTANAGTLVASAGQAANISSANVDMQLNLLTSTNSTGRGVLLTTVTGTFSAGSGSSITNATNADFEISGGTANVTYGGTITDDVGTLVSISGATGGTKSFTGAITDGNDGDGGGVSLTGNTGATITFSGGLTLSTGANAAFTATGGGTINATQNNTSIVNTLTTTTGTALNVANTTIGASGLTFRSISSDGGSNNGIILDTTGSTGGLTVTGDGTNTSLGGNSSGGTIANKSGADGSTTQGLGIYLNNTSNVVLRRMNIHDHTNYGIRGLLVNGFTLEYATVNSTISGSSKNGTNVGVDEGSVIFGVRAGTTGLTGTASIINTIIEDGVEDNLGIYNTSGTLNATIENVSINQAGNGAIITDQQVGGTINIAVNNSDFTNNFGPHFFAGANGAANVHVTFGNTGANTLTNTLGDAIVGGTVGVQTGVAWSGTGSANISNNTITGAQDTPLNVNIGGTGTFTATLNANTIGTSGVAESGTDDNEDAIRIVANGDKCCDPNNPGAPHNPNPVGGTLTAAVTNNTIQQVSGRGIYALARDGGTSGDPIELNLTITGNILRQSPTSGGQGIRVEAGASSMPIPDDVRIHANIGGAGAARNDFQDDWGTNLPAGIDFDEIRITHPFSGNCQFILTGLGANTSNVATVATYLTNRNILPVGGVASATINGGGVYEDGGTPPPPAAQPIEDDQPPHNEKIGQGVEKLTGAEASMLVARIHSFGQNLKSFWAPVFSAFARPKAPADNLKFSDKSVAATPSATAATEPRPEATPLVEGGGASHRNLGQLARPIFSAFAALTGYVKLDQVFDKAVETLAPTAVASELLVPPSSGSDSAVNTLLPKGGTTNKPAKTMIVNSRGEYRIVPTAALPKLMAGELITINGTGSGFLLPAGESTTIMFNAQISSSYTFPSISNQASVSGTGFGPILSNNLTTDVIQPPFLAKSFSPSSIATNGTATLQFALLNTNNTQTLSQVTFTDVLPVGLNVADGSQSACGGTVTRIAATRTIQFTGSSLAVGPPCTFNVTVTAGPTEGMLTNTTSAPDSLESDAGTAATANINVINPPSFAKMFAPNSIPVGGTSTLSFTINNNSAAFPLNSVGFTDTLPSDLVVATPNGLTGSCGGGTITATQATNTISLSGATLAATGSCTFSVNVTAPTTGAKNNSATLATTELGATSASTGTVTLNVVAPPTISKAFSPTSIFVGGTFSQLTFTITNPNGSGTLTGVGFSDALPSGLQVDATPGVVVSNCGGSTNTSSFTTGATSLTVSNAAVTAGTNCTIRVNVSGTTPGAKNNTTGPITSTEGGTGTTSNTATLNVFTAPQITKSFGASTIPVGGTTTVTFTITNPAANPGALTTITFIDSLPAGMVVVNPPVPTNTCGGSVTAVNGSGTISLGGASIATPGNSCQVQATVMATTAGVKNNSVQVSSGNGGVGNTATASITVANPPTLAKAFSPSLITPNGTSTLTVTLSNSNTIPLTGASVTDTLPVGVTTVNSTAATTCGGTASQTSGAVSLSGGTIPANGSCTLTVDVTSATNGTYTNTIAAGALTTNDSSANASPASAVLTVANPPTLSKAFSPNSILSGGTSTLTITLTNPNSNVPLTLSSPLVDTLPVGVTTVAATHANTCGGTSSQMTGSVTLTGGSIPTSGSCTLSVNVTSTTAGGHTNTIAAGALVTNGGSNANPASASLVVGAAPQVDKGFGASTMVTGSTTMLTIAITNNNGTLPFNGVSFTDTLPAGLTVPDAAATPTCGGMLTVASNVITLTGATIAAGANCTTTFTITGATAGVKNNTVTVDTSNFGTGYTDTATVTVYDAPTIAKSFTPSSVPFGGTSMMSFVLTNPNSFSGGDLTGLAFPDTLPPGITVGNGSTSVCGGTLTTVAPNMVTFSGGALGISGPGNTCTINVNVTGSQLGMWPNSVNALTSTQTGTVPVSASATLTVTKSPTTTTITSDTPDPSVTGQVYTVAANVVATPPGMGTPTGTITVSDGTGGTCTITLPAASCVLTSTTAGAKTLTATYSGDANFDPSNDTEAHTVNKADTTAAIISDAPDPSVVGQGVTVTYTVSVTSPGSGTPTGNVLVSDGVNSCTGTVAAGQCVIALFTPGVRTLTATYQGDADYNASPASPGAGHQVNKADTTTTITSDNPDPSVFGGTITVNFTVAAVAPGVGTPTGTVTITVSGGAETCTGPLNGSGMGSCTLALTAVGNRTLTATYNGDSSYQGSSGTDAHTVNKADTVTTITSDNPDSSAVGQNVVVNFTVAASAPGAGVPTGTVTITASGGSESCTGTLAAGAGTCTLALTVPGSRTLTATYNGDTNFNTSTDDEPHVVVAPPSIAKSFNPMAVPLNGVSTLTLAITNPAVNTVALTGVGVVDNFLPGAPGMVVHTTPGATNSCATGAFAPVAGANSISISGATIPVGTTCNFTVQVRGTISGAQVNTTGNVTSTNGGTGNSATATLQVNVPPVITPANLSRAAGSTTANLTIASVTDAEDPEDQLAVQISTDGTNFFDSVTAGNVTVTLVDQVAGGSVNPTAAGAVIATIITPCNAVVGPLNLFLRATDTGGQVDTEPWTLTITPNPSPVLSYGPATVTAGTTPVINPATGPSDNGTINPLVLQSIVPGTGLTLSLNPATGQMMVTGATLIGNYMVTVTATDNCGATTSAVFAINVVCPAITLSPASLPNATVNTAYSQTIAASPSGGSYTFAVTSGSLPAGLTLNSNGSFSGAPTVGGTFNFRVTANGFGGCTAFRDYTLVVVCPAITVNPASLPGGSVGTSYSQTVAGSPAGTYSYSVTSGALPAGLTLNASTGAITGTPATTGSFNFTITASAGACSGSRTYTVTIACPTITLSPASPLPGGPAGVAYSQTISVSPAGSYTFSLISGSLPSGITLNPATGVLSGLPSTVGSFTFTVKAQTAGGCNGTQAYTLAIVCPTVTLSPASMPGGSTGTAYSQTISASPAGGSYTYAVTVGSLPTGLNLNSATGVLSGTPTAAGSFTFRVTATGFGGCTGFRDYTIVIGGGGCPTITLPASLPNGSVGQLYNAAATASPSGSYNYTAAGSLPPGVTLYNSNGLIFGYPTAAGSYTFTITATAGACSAGQTYTVLIGAGFASSLTVFSDFDGDGKSDLSVWRGTDGNWLVAASGDGQVRTTPWGASYAPYNDVTVSGDYDGDGKTDLAVFRRGGAQAGYWYIKQSSDGQVKSHFWGLGTDVPVPGDYDGDGKTDVAVWRGSVGAWYILRSSDGGIEARTWGYAPVGDIPVPGDYDGDSKTDLAVFRRSTGFWYIRRSSDAVTISTEWGVGTDVPVPGDYDGDGKTDLAVWRGSEGAWHIVESGSALLKTESIGAAALGDVPVVADYDGDGKADPAIWQRFTGAWKIKRSSDAAEVSKTLGQNGDSPVMARRN